MRLDRSVGLPVMFVALGSGWALGADSAAEAVLKEKGLTKVGRAFVIEAEVPALARMKEVRAAFASYAALVDRQAMAEQVAAQVAQLDEQKAHWQGNLDDLNERINLQGSGGGFPRQGGMNGQQAAFGPSLINQRNQVRTALAEIDREQKSLKSQTSQVKDKKALDEDVQKKAEAFKSALADLRPVVDDVTKKYAVLAADESVQGAMTEVKKASMVKLKLGPSDAFLAAAKELEQAERRFLGKKAAVVARKKGKSKK